MDVVENKILASPSGITIAFSHLSFFRKPWDIRIPEAI
jgi:hypothetical protein